MSKFWIIQYPNDPKYKGLAAYVKFTKWDEKTWQEIPILCCLPKNAMPYWDFSFAKATLGSLKPVKAKLRPRLLMYESGYLAKKDCTDYNYKIFRKWAEKQLVSDIPTDEIDLMQLAYEKGLEDARK